MRFLCCSYASISCSMFMFFSFVCFILSPSCNIFLLFVLLVRLRGLARPCVSVCQALFVFNFFCLLE